MTSPQPSYNLIGNFTYSAKPRGFRCRSGSAAMLKSSFLVSVKTDVQHLPVGNLSAERVVSPSPSLPSFRKINHNTHSASPVRLVAETNMEKSVSEVSKIKNGALSASDIQQARDIHQRLVVRMMTSPGDSKGAMYRIEAAFGLSYHCQFNLRHQNRASGEFVARLDAVWLTVLEQSVTRDVAELLAEREKREVA